MKRREFVKKAATLTAGSLVMPYLLPTGRLFAKTNAPLAEHVVYVILVVA
jgi:hypothetical protein